MRGNEILTQYNDSDDNSVDSPPPSPKRMMMFKNPYCDTTLKKNLEKNDFGTPAWAHHQGEKSGLSRFTGGGSHYGGHHSSHPSHRCRNINAIDPYDYVVQPFDYGDMSSSTPPLPPQVSGLNCEKKLSPSKNVLQITKLMMMNLKIIFFA